MEGVREVKTVTKAATGACGRGLKLETTDQDLSLLRVAKTVASLERQICEELTWIVTYQPYLD